MEPVVDVPQKKRGRKRKIQNVVQEADVNKLMEPVVDVPQKKRGRPKKKQNVTEEADGSKKVTRSLKLVGRYVRKEFEGIGEFLGKISSYDTGLYRVEYEDGDFEDLDSGEVKLILIDDGDLNRGWAVKKKKLDKFLLSKETNEKVVEAEKVVEKEDVDGMANPINADAVVVVEDVVKGCDAVTASVAVAEDVGKGCDAVAASVSVAEDVVKVCDAVAVVEDVVKACDADAEAVASDDDDDSSSDSFEDAQEPVVEVPPVPQPELPVSSRNIGIMEKDVSHLFSVYSFLRSFSTTLFLYPFSLNEFVGALNCSVANTLLDSVHVALMRVLRTHYERLLADGSELASKCLRSLDWSLLDTLTWPVFLAQYLMVTGHTNGPDWKSFYAHSLDRDYYALSAGRKLINLQILCDDVMDSDELRAEMDMREESEVGIDVDSAMLVDPVAGPKRVHPRYSKTSAYKNRETEHNGKPFHGSHVTTSGAPVDGSEDEDCNGDECRLCGMDGFLLCCDGCPSSYHTRCLGLTKLQMTSGSWYCPECKINETEPKISHGTVLTGGVNFGVDPYEQAFVASCDHLLVLTTSINSENCIRYYIRHDIPRVLRALCAQPEHVLIYSEICRGIMQHWELTQDILPCLQFVTTVGSDDKSVTEMNEIESTLSSVTGSCTNNSGLVNDASLVANTTHSFVKRDDTVDKKADPIPKDGCLYMGSPFKTNGYINNYWHGDYAASAAASLAVLSSEESQAPDSRPPANHRKLISTNVSLQVKAFSLAAFRFVWPNTEKKLFEVPRERCSWCFWCKAPLSSRRGCLLNAAATSSTRGAMKVLSGICAVKDGDTRRPSIATYIMFMEESLSGLVGGPFLSDTFRKRWRGEVERAVTFNAIKILLLELEENIRPIALSGEWTKLVDGSPIQSSAPQAVNAASSTQKRRPGRRGRKSATVVEAAANDSEDVSNEFTWWRGGTLSKLMFHRAALPFSVLRKAARQGGSKKIPSVQYCEGHEIPKISRQLMWRSAVDICRNMSQLALQVRYLDFYVRWSDLSRPDQVPTDGKGPETEASAFRNAFVCSKKSLEQEIRYCVAFGSQKHLPSRVMKNIAEVDPNSEDGKPLYWFSETRIPLYLIKDYEEKAKKINPVDVLTAPKILSRPSKASRKTKLLDLLRKFNNMVICCSCRHDVPQRDAIKCNVCQGLCHNQCASGSTVQTNEEVEFLIMCTQCRDKRAAIQVKSSNESPTSPLLVKIKVQNTVSTKKSGKISGKKRSLSSIKAPEPTTVKKLTIVSSASANRSRNKNWGLVWKSQKPEDTGNVFRLKNVLYRGNTDPRKRPICRLCSKPYNADLMYILCETCDAWVHAVALEVDESKISELVGYKCCKCRRIRSSICPYMDSDKREKLLAMKPERQKSKKGEIFEMDSYDSREHYESYPGGDVNQYSVDDPLLSLSDLDQYTEGNPEIDYGWSNSTSFVPGPQKLPVRRQNKQQNVPECSFQKDSYPVEVSSAFEPNPLNSGGKLQIRRHNKIEKTDDAHNIEGLNSSEQNKTDAEQDISFPQVQWDVSTENFDEGITLDYGFGDTDFEPQTYFSFNELLASDDASRATENGKSVTDWENLNILPENGSIEISYDQEEPFFSVDSDIPILVSCKICSNCNPFPNLYCKVCGVWMHSHCSPWVDDSSSVNGWTCGSCRG